MAFISTIATIWVLSVGVVYTPTAIRGFKSLPKKINKLKDRLDEK